MNWLGGGIALKALRIPFLRFFAGFTLHPDASSDGLVVSTFRSGVSTDCAEPRLASDSLGFFFSSSLALATAASRI